ncbi:MAG: DUF58 domain-containing protein [Betaproteobacteria bacterium]|nr:DUF58 domain-containing protein [Betaproteobacteria bacterium]
MRAAASFKRWLFRLYGPEPAPIVLTQRRIFVLPTRAGLAFAATLGFMLIGAINYNLSLGYALVFLLTGLGLVTLLHTFRNLVQLEISPGRADPVFAGETALFTVLINNRRSSDRCAVHLHFSDAPAVIADLAADSTSPIGIPSPAARRGWLRPGRITLESRYPLVLVRAWSYAEPDIRCLVYPAPESSAPPLPLAACGAAGGAPGGSGLEDFSGLRSHTPSDSPKHIAWKAVAREQPLLTKQFTGTNQAEAWLDWGALPPGLDVEARLSRLTRWVLDAKSAGISYGLRLPGLEIPLGTGERHHETCLKALALHGGKES